METAQILGQVAVLVALCIAKVQLALQAGGGFAGVLQGKIHAAEDFPGFLEENLPRRRQGYRTAVAVEQLDADVFFQRMDLLGDGCLGDIVVHGSLGKASQLCHGDEIAQLIEIDRNPLLCVS